MIRFLDVCCADLEGVTFEVVTGECTRVALASAETRSALVRALLGLERPRAGHALLLEHEVTACPPAQARTLLARTGVVWAGGGLVSNLQVGNNLLLPFAYHRGRPGPEVEARARALCEVLGLETSDAALGRLPAELSPTERCLAGVVRAWLTDPEVMIYEGVLDGLATDRARGVAEVVCARHCRGPTTLWLTADDRAPQPAMAALALRQEGHRLVEGAP
jgi:phospholipid/cholesterol/gamma-HCH transport system ATP-binding protein